MKTYKAKENFAGNHSHNILKLFDVLLNYIILLKYELPHELRNNLRLVLSLPAKMKILLILAKNA